jgi:IS30 family transposase
MEQRFLEILDHLPEMTSRSRLEPYKELIRELRRRQRSYREIARVLAEHCGIRVCHSTLHEFVERYLPDESAVRAGYLAPRRAAQDQPAGFQFDGSEPLRLRPGKR